MDIKTLLNNALFYQSLANPIITVNGSSSTWYVGSNIPVTSPASATVAWAFTNPDSALVGAYGGKKY
jgi:hypothetical protein